MDESVFCYEGHASSISHGTEREKREVFILRSKHRYTISATDASFRDSRRPITKHSYLMFCVYC